MQITRFSDYALRVLIHLAYAGDEVRTAREIAAAQGIPFNHLSKAAQWLAGTGYVHATRGRNGGMTLAREPSGISIGALLRKTEAGSPLVECFRPDGGACPLSPACGLAVCLSGAQEAFYSYLDGKTLADVVGAKPGLGRLVEDLHGRDG